MIVSVQRRFAKPVSIVWVVLVVVWVSTPSAGAADDPPAKPVRVLVLNSYHSDFPWSLGVVRAITGHLATAKRPVEVVAEYMDTKRHAPEVLEDDLVSLYRHKYRGTSFDAVVCVDNNALEFLKVHRQELFGDVPVVFCGINSFEDRMIAGQDNITGVAEDIDPLDTLALARRLHGGLTTVAAISDVSPTSRLNLQRVKQAAAELGMSVISLDELTIEQLRRRIAELPGGTVILYLDYYRTPDGQVLTLQQGLRLASSRTDLPVYSLWEDKMRSPVVGGVIATAESQGRAAAEMVLQILDGRPASQIPIVRQSPFVTVVNYPELVRFGIDPDSVPPDALVLNRPVTFFDRHGRLVASAAGVLLVLSATIVAMGWHIRQRRHSERALGESRERYRDLIQTMTYGVEEVDLEGRIVFCNDAFCRMLGYEPDGLTGQFIWDRETTPEDTRRLKDYVEVLKQQQPPPQPYQSENVRRDGSVIDVWVDWNYKRDQQGKLLGFISVVTDVTERNRAERELKLSEEKFARVFRDAPLLMAISSLEDGRFLEVNEAFVRMVGYPRREINGRVSTDLGVIQDDRRKRLKDLLLEHGRVSEFEITVRRKDGAVRHCLLSGSLIEIEGTPRLLSIGIDITERNEAARLLQESEARFEAIVSNVGDGISIVDPEEVFVFANPAACRIFGVPEGELVGQRLEAFMDEPTFAAMQEQTGRRRLGSTDQYEIEITRPDGSRRQLMVTSTPRVDAHGAFAGAYGIFRDVTERRLAERALEQRERDLSRAQSMAQLGAWRFDLDSGTVVASEQARAIYGLSGRQWTIDQVQVLPLEEYRDDLDKALCELIENGTPYDLEFRIRRPGDGEIRYIHSVAEYDAENNLVVGTIQDVTEREELQEQLRRMEKMDAIGQLAGGVAHDFNNQLAGVLGYADMLVSRLDDARLKRYAENIRVGARRAGDLTRQLLAFARKGQYRRAPVNLHETIAEVVAILEHTIDRRIELQQVLKARPAVTMGDPTQLQNALLNLGLNARDAMPEGGRLTFETALVDLDARQAVALAPEMEPGGYVLVTVSDTGCGMDERTLAHIFEPFFTTKEPGQGTGMGLAAVYGTATHHGGVVRVESTPGQGSTFRLYLPACDLRHEPGAVESNAVGSIPPAHVLVVDDEAMFRTMARDMLGEMGCTVETRSDGQQALDWYRDHWQQVDLVILDLVMPRMDGRDTFAAIRQVNPGGRVLLSSGYSINGTAEDLLADGAAGFIQKPFSRDELLKKVAEVLGCRQRKSREMQ